MEHAPHEVAQGNGDMNTLSWTSNFWVNNYVANQAYNRYSQMIPDIRKVQSELENAINEDVAVAIDQVPSFDTEDAKELLQNLADIWAKKATDRYKQLGDYLFVKYMDGNMKNEENGQFKRNEYGMPAYPSFPGYDERYYRSIVKDAGEHLKVREINYK